MNERAGDTNNWIDNPRLVFPFPESPSSNVLMRCIIGSDAEHDRMSEVMAVVIDERRAMSEADIAAEIADYEEYLRQNGIV